MAPEKQKKELILPFEMAEAGHDWIFNRIFDHRIHDFMLDNKRNEMTAKLKCIGTQHRSTAGAISTAPGSRTAAAQAEGTRLLLCFVVPSSAWCCAAVLLCATTTVIIRHDIHLVRFCPSATGDVSCTDTFYALRYERAHGMTSQSKRLPRAMMNYNFQHRNIKPGICFLKRNKNRPRISTIYERKRYTDRRLSTRLLP